MLYMLYCYGPFPPQGAQNLSFQAWRFSSPVHVKSSENKRSAYKFNWLVHPTFRTEIAIINPDSLIYISPFSAVYAAGRAVGYEGKGGAIELYQLYNGLKKAVAQEIFNSGIDVPNTLITIKEATELSNLISKSGGQKISIMHLVTHEMQTYLLKDESWLIENGYIKDE